MLFLLLTGGEPLLYPGFWTLYAKLKRMGFILAVNTNGTMIDEDWADFLAAHKPRRVNITLYGAAMNVDPYMTPAVRERTKPFEQQARLAPEEAARVRVESMRRELGETQFPLYADAIVRAVKEDALPRAEDMSCQAGRCSFAVNWQGQMRPCVMLEKPAVPVFDVGFEEAWRVVSHGVESIRISPRCVSCSLRRSAIPARPAHTGRPAIAAACRNTCAATRRRPRGCSKRKSEYPKNGACRNGDRSGISFCALSEPPH